MPRSHSARKVALAETSTPLSTPSGATARVAGDEIHVRDAGGKLVVSFCARTSTLTLECDRGDLVLRAPRGRVRIEGEKVELAAGTLEVRAGRVLERLIDVYREIEGTLHTSAAAVRTLVRGTHETFARDTRIASEEDTAIDGKHVLLG